MFPFSSRQTTIALAVCSRFSVNASAVSSSSSALARSISSSSLSRAKERSSAVSSSSSTSPAPKKPSSRATTPRMWVTAPPWVMGKAAADSGSPRAPVTTGEGYRQFALCLNYWF